MGIEGFLRYLRYELNYSVHTVLSYGKDLSQFADFADKRGCGDPRGVTVADVREIVDEAIGHAERKSLRHFMDVLLRKRYDEDDMIILRERDFI